MLGDAGPMAMTAMTDGDDDDDDGDGDGR